MLRWSKNRSTWSSGIAVNVLSFYRFQNGGGGCGQVLSATFPAKPRVFKGANFCNFPLLMMTLAWVETSNKIDKSHLSDPWLV